jgi:hypothetical protein
MTFHYPYVLFTLLAIPILITIYILRNKYKETTAPSTYLWELSAKFLKKRNPLRKMEHLWILIIQLACIAAMAFALAKPTFTLKGKADNMVFVLDTTASMGITHNNSTRFEKAKAQILEKAGSAAKGSTFSLIVSENDSRVICKKVNDFDRFKIYLDSVGLTTTTSKLDTSLNLAQELFSDGSANVCYLATDKIADASAIKNIELIDVSDDEKNYAIRDFSYSYVDDTLTLNGQVVAYDDNIPADGLELKVDITINDKELGYQPVKIAPNLSGVDQPFSVTPKITLPNGKDDIEVIKAEILNEDALPVDNTFYIYNTDTATETDILVVSAKPFYLKSVFKALGNITVKTLAPASYTDGASEGYDIVVFDAFTPDVLPSNGAIWMIGTEASIDGTGFVYQTTNNATNDDDDDDGTMGANLSYANNNDSILYNQLTAQTANNQIIVSKYERYSLMQNFTTILTYRNMPMVFAGKNDLQQREVVFAFDLHDSNLPLKYDFVALMHNFVNYSNPKNITKFDYEVNDEMTISISENNKKMTFVTPSGKKEPLAIARNDGYVTYELAEVGTYTLTIENFDGNSKEVRLFASFPKEESNPAEKDTTAYVLAKNENTVKGDGIFDNILPLIIVVAVLFGLDWILYAHEQY